MRSFKAEQDDHLNQNVAVGDSRISPAYGLRGVTVVKEGAVRLVTGPAWVGGRNDVRDYNTAYVPEGAHQRWVLALAGGGPAGRCARWVRTARKQHVEMLATVRALVKAAPNWRKDWGHPSDMLDIVECSWNVGGTVASMTIGPVTLTAYLREDEVEVDGGKEALWRIMPDTVRGLPVRWMPRQKRWD